MSNETGMKQDTVRVNILPLYTSKALRCGKNVKKKNIFFSDVVHAAYQIKGKDS